MSISVNGQSRVPPGFRFHPTEEELLHYYLRKKVSSENIDLNVIFELDLNKLEPWDIQEKCKIGTTPQNDWYFFSHKDKKYPTGTRTNRATLAGFWKATGRDKIIYGVSGRIGMRKTLVFYQGRAPRGLKSDWIMHEYRLGEDTIDTINVTLDGIGDEGWVVCRIFKKKNHQKIESGPRKRITESQTLNSSIDEESDSLEQIIDEIFMNKSNLKEEKNMIIENNNYGKYINNKNNNNNNNNNNKDFFNIQSPNSTSSYQPMIPEITTEDSTANWSTFDQLVASQLNGQTETFSIFMDPTFVVPTEEDEHLQFPAVRSSLSASSSLTRSYHGTITEDYNRDIDLWSLIRSSSSSSLASSASCPLRQLSTDP